MVRDGSEDVIITVVGQCGCFFLIMVFFLACRAPWSFIRVILCGARSVVYEANGPLYFQGRQARPPN